ncbi:MAG: YicC/YloC family endoribonuclease [Flavobacteriales bacterium]
MTGFGKAQGEVGKTTVSVDIRALNSKQLDLNLRIPFQFREKEAEIRQEAGKVLERGKVDISIHIISDQQESSVKINTDAARQYYRSIRMLAEEFNEPTNDILNMVMRIPEVYNQTEQKLSDEEWKQLKHLLDASLQKADAFREHEGAALRDDLLARVSSISGFLPQLQQYEDERVMQVRQRLKQKLTEWLESDKIDENRLEQELVYYIEKFDISEEKTRLLQHCEYFRDTIVSPENTGKKLGFIAQEMGREINTIGSKANHAMLQKIVVLMKDELEKIKEQLNNIV